MPTLQRLLLYSRLLYSRGRNQCQKPLCITGSTISAHVFGSLCPGTVRVKMQGVWGLQGTPLCWRTHSHSRGPRHSRQET